jgi:hypothetical protein
MHPAVTPAEAGVQKTFRILDSRFRGNDSKKEKNRFFSSLLTKGKGYAGNNKGGLLYTRAG